MHWHNYILLSNKATQLEATLKPIVVTRNGEIKSTAFTDVNNKVITLDVSEPPLKCALSYAYELKNLENADQYQAINEKAKNNRISKSEYVKSFIKLEAEAVYFRCQVFREIEVYEKNPPFQKVYLELYEATKNMPKEESLKVLSRYMLDNSIARREYTAKKYYADSYDFYAGKKAWPTFYNQKRSKTILIIENTEKNNSLTNTR